MKELISKEQVLRAINYKLKIEENYLKNSKEDVRKRIYSRSVTILKELKDIYENCQINTYKEEHSNRR